jgi:hypothetical protein
MKYLICIHGLDENICPTCRIIKSTLPKNIIDTKDNAFLKIENPLFRKNYRKDQEIIKELFPKKVKTNSNLINFVSKPNRINEIPNFKNRMLSERLNELDLTKFDKMGINKRTPLESPEWKFEEE